MTEPEIEDGYPTEATEKFIASWPNYMQFRELMEYVKKAWRYADWGWSEEETTDGGRRYSISTAGWSGNESLIGALQDNRMFWMLCWQESRRGGHYVFEVRALAPAKTEEPK